MKTTKYVTRNNHNKLKIKTKMIIHKGLTKLKIAVEIKVIQISRPGIISKNLYC